jgi:hypothetical protein
MTENGIVSHYCTWTTREKCLTIVHRRQEKSVSLLYMDDQGIIFNYCKWTTRGHYYIIVLHDEKKLNLLNEDTEGNHGTLISIWTNELIGK